MKNTLTDIVKELWDEEGNVTEIRVDGEDLYQKYYNKIRKQFDKILEVAGIDKKTMKIGKEYVIDYEDKELVKIVNGNVIIAAHAIPININEIINIYSL